LETIEEIVRRRRHGTTHDGIKMTGPLAAASARLRSSSRFRILLTASGPSQSLRQACPDA
jgi:hypothetical protein